MIWVRQKYFKRSQKVFWDCLFGRNDSAFMCCCIKLDELLIKVFIKNQDWCYVVTSVAIVWRWPHCHQLLVKHFLVALHDQLMRTANQRDVVRVVETLYYIATEKISGSSRAENPTIDVWIRKIMYHQDLTTSSRTWHHRGGFTVYGQWNESNFREKSYFIDRVVDGRTESTMDTEDLVVNDSSKWQVIEDVCAISPNIEWPIFPETFVVEPINLGDLSAFMVASDKRDEIGISDLVSKEQQEGLDAIEASVYEITQEQVVDWGDVTTFLEQLQQVVELTVDIAANCHRWIYSLHVALLDKDLSGLCTEVLYLLFGNGLAFSQLGDLLIQKTAHFVCIFGWRVIY